ncbi:hypothetical protein J2X65_001654 [Ancylobacter sp. 3268]|uniref:head-tail joining protein n=1 Tax=Ancylobacter sp. 3268 TaxID=2817752 RepID=UPI002854CC5B|nr:hypothetical protein [Ancylobacter sp. 3268]MDR6952299.1 hypothetical protein [Ancylobacter sp. 3268]
MSAYAHGVDFYFNDVHLGADALFRAGGDDPVVELRVVTRRPDDLIAIAGTQLVRATTIIDVREADIAVPAEGDTFEIDGIVYMIDGEPRRRDDDHRIWACGCRKVAA